MKNNPTGYIGDDLSKLKGLIERSFTPGAYNAALDFALQCASTKYILDSVPKRILYKTLENEIADLV